MTPPNQLPEWVDIVDSGGQVIRAVPRSVMRQQRLPHRAVYVLVFDSTGQLLIHQRTATKDVYPGYWDLCVGGVPQAGESFDEAALRETAEEIGITAAPTPLFHLRYQDEQTDVFGAVYRLHHDGPFRFQVEEIVQGEFVPVDELPRLIQERPFCPDGLFVWREYLRRARDMPWESG